MNKIKNFANTIVSACRKSCDMKKKIMIHPYKMNLIGAIGKLKCNSSNIPKQLGYYDACLDILNLIHKCGINNINKTKLKMTYTTKLKTITLGPTNGTKTIAQAKDIFTGYLDSDFKNWDTDVKSNNTQEQEVDVFKLKKDATFNEIYPSFGKNLDDLCLTQAQIIEFVTSHNGDLSDSYTLFLFKSRNEFFVARVFVSSDGSLEAGVYGLSYGDVWGAGFRHRFVLPQLDSSTLSIPCPSDTLTLEKAIEMCKENGLTVSKAY